MSQYTLRNFAYHPLSRVLNVYGYSNFTFIRFNVHFVEQPTLFRQYLPHSIYVQSLIKLFYILQKVKLLLKGKLWNIECDVNILLQSTISSLRYLRLKLCNFHYDKQLNILHTGKYEREGLLRNRKISVQFVCPLASVQRCPIFIFHTVLTWWTHSWKVTVLLMTSYRMWPPGWARGCHCLSP